MSIYGWYQPSDMLGIPSIELSSPTQLPSEPAVSVLLMTRNHQEFIEQAVVSAIEQETPFPVEVLIGEDHSTDATLEACRRLQRKYPDTARLIHADSNVGITANFLRLVSRARGKYCALLEGDDYWTRTDKLALQLALMEENPQWAWCGARTENRTLPVAARREYDLRDHARRYIFHTSSIFFRRCALHRYPRFPDMVGWDSLLSIYLSQQGASGFVNETLSYYRHHAGGLWWGKTRSGQFELATQATEAMRNHLEGAFASAIVSREYWIFRNLLTRDIGGAALAESLENLSLFWVWRGYLWRQSRMRAASLLLQIVTQPATLLIQKARRRLALRTRASRLLAGRRGVRRTAQG